MKNLEFFLVVSPVYMYTAVWLNLTCSTTLVESSVILDGFVYCVRGELRFQNSGNVAAKDVHEDKPADFGGLKRVLGNTIHYSNVAEKSMT